MREITFKDMYLVEAQTLPSKKGGTFSIARFRSLDMGDVKAFCRPEQIEGLKASTGKLGVLTVGVQGGRFGDPQFSCVSFA